MKTKVHYNSIIAYNQFKAENKDIKEAEYILSILPEIQPITSRELSNITGIERTNITRVLYDLKNANIIKEAFSAKCGKTNRTVSFYCLV